MNKRIFWMIALYSGIFASSVATIWIFYDILNYGKFCAIEPNLWILTAEFAFFGSLILIFPIYAFYNMRKEVNEEFDRLVKERTKEKKIKKIN